MLTGTPDLGWSDTLAFLTLPLILYATQSITSKTMVAPRDETKEMTEQEAFSLSLTNNLPFVTAFFSLNVPAGLAVYWIINNIITTGITLLVQNQFVGEQMPPEVDLMMAVVDAPVMNNPGSSELRNMMMLEESKKDGLGGALQAIDDTMSQSQAAEDEEEDTDDDKKKSSTEK